MSKEVTGIIEWLRSWFDDIYEPKGSGSGNITLDDVYPVGSIYISVSSTSPSSLFGGTWSQLTDTFLYASNTADTGTTAPNGQGEATHTLTVDEMPSHTHNNTNGSNRFMGMGMSSSQADTTSGFTSGNLWNNTGKANTTIAKTGGDTNGNTVPHNNMPPYMRVYMWKRTG